MDTLKKTGQIARSLAILLAVYDPREDWLIELLDSLNAQTYPNLRLYVRDDASPHDSFERLSELVGQHVTNFPFVLHRNEVNRGSNETFGALVRDCNEHYIAFCDQDDIWDADKLSDTVALYETSPLTPTLVCSNVRVIDGDGKPIAPDMESHRKRHIFLRGEGLAPTLIYRNFALGCTMVMERARALSYLPFPAEAVHDHYLAFRAACDGALDFLAEPQMQYRVYGGNQTGVMTGVRSKQDYLERRILVFDKRVRCFAAYASFPELQSAADWSAARLDNFHRKKGGFRALCKTAYVNRVTSLFELVALRFPAAVFRFAIRLVQKGFL